MGAASMQYWQGDLDRARTNSSRALALSQDVGDTDAVVFAEYVLGYVEVTAGNLDAARDWLTRCLKGFQAQASPFGAGEALPGLAWVALAAGNKAVTDRTGAIDVDDTVRDLRESAERDASTRLGAERWARAYAAGRESSIEALIQDIDRALARPRPDVVVQGQREHVDREPR